VSVTFFGIFNREVKKVEEGKEVVRKKVKKRRLHTPLCKPRTLRTIPQRRKERNAAFILRVVNLFDFLLIDRGSGLLFAVKKVKGVKRRKKYLHYSQPRGIISSSAAPVQGPTKILLKEYAYYEKMYVSLG
jgi:hypothetical protein